MFPPHPSPLPRRGEGIVPLQRGRFASAPPLSFGQFHPLNAGNLDAPRPRLRFCNVLTWGEGSVAARPLWMGVPPAEAPACAGMTNGGSLPLNAAYREGGG